MMQICFDKILEILGQTRLEVTSPALGFVEYVHCGHQQSVLVLEVVIDGPFGNPCLPRHLPRSGTAKPLLRKDPRGRPENLLAPRRNHQIPHPTRLGHRRSSSEHTLIILSVCSYYIRWQTWARGLAPIAGCWWSAGDESSPAEVLTRWLAEMVPKAGTRRRGRYRPRRDRRGLRVRGRTGPPAGSRSPCSRKRPGDSRSLWTPGPLSRVG